MIAETIIIMEHYFNIYSLILLLGVQIKLYVTNYFVLGTQKEETSTYIER